MEINTTVENASDVMDTEPQEGSIRQEDGEAEGLSQEARVDDTSRNPKEEANDEASSITHTEMAAGGVEETTEAEPNQVNEETGEHAEISVSVDDIGPERKGSGKSKRRRKRAKDGIHKVTMTVTIAKAIPTAEEDVPKLDDLMRKKKRIVEAPKAQNYYHCQYYLLPDDTEAIKTDVVTFGMAAKIYTEHDSKVLKTWQEKNQTWIAWSHSHTLKVTKELLLKLFNHTLELRIWDSKEKVSSRARFDRPKAFRLPQAKPGEDAEDVGGVRSLVMKQSESYMSLQPRKSFIDRPVPQHGPAELKGIKNFDRKDAKGRPVPASPENISKTKTPSHTPTTEVAVVDKTASGEDVSGISPKETKYDIFSAVPLAEVQSGEMKSYSHLNKLAGLPPPEELKEIKKKLKKEKIVALAKKEGEGLMKRQTQVESGGKGRDSSQGRGGDSRAGSNSAPTPGRRGLKESPQQREARRKSHKAEHAAAALAMYIKQHGNACIPIRMKLLFAGLRSVTNRLTTPVHGLEDVFITVSLDGPLMSEALRRELNPLIIKVSSASSMPSTPQSFRELSRRCMPVYTAYTFFKEPMYESCRKPHGRNIYWEDVNVELLGIIPKGELVEYFHGPPLEVEVRDRDRRPEEIKQKPTLFGEDIEDDKISNVGMVTAKRTLHNPFHTHIKPWDPYGLAKFDLSDLLLGERVLNLTSPIHSCQLPDVIGRNRTDTRLIGYSNSADGPKDEPLPMGHYLESHSQLKIRVEVSYPLTSSQEVKLKEEMETPPECPFARMVYIFECKNTEFLHMLVKLVTLINATALNLDQMPPHIIEAALSTYKLSEAQQESPILDIVTGFQVMDGEKHIFVLEGLREKAVKLMWETLPRPKAKDAVTFQALYNSNMTFSERRYASLDVDLCRVRLHEPLSSIVQQPLLYVRDMIPKLCLDAITRLDMLLRQDILRNATRNDLFPTAEMIVSLSKEFGVPLTAADFEEMSEKEAATLQDETRQADIWRAQTASPQHRQREWTPLDLYNDRYLDLLEERRLNGQESDHIKINIEAVQEVSNRNKSKKVKPVTIRSEPENGVTHNYSTQTLNSTEQAKELLRQELAKEPDRRFTYCEDYNSATVVPVNVDVVRKLQELDSVDAWQTADGFIFPGMQAALEDNAHSRHPDVARRDELKQPWKENTLHANALKPTLEERDGYSWSDRKKDMDVWKRPSKGFQPIPPITIHLAGDTLNAEKREARNLELEDWRTKIVTDDTQMKFHRCATDTELYYRGPKSSSQVARLKGLLKDEPKKLSLRQAGMNDIPALAVVNDPSVDTLAREAGVPIIPAVDPQEVERNCGFMPGPYDDKSWSMEKNKIPIKDMEHAKFSELKKYDFKLYHKERGALHKRFIQPLNKEDKNNHLFRTMPVTNTAPVYSASKQKLRPGNECFRQPSPSLKAKPLQTEFYYPNREQFWKTTCQRDVTNRRLVMQNDSA
ncbi:uncharacterized protein LOC117306814 [Asterias rubens]|uniref:uncharacterized protein LOC117306814 n=1 Tax=Asterias rubens TaxID=7604 RepID=UPI001455C7A5|nr:uncharacterized protein LOC117306814 [Asterias rubens]XP_033647232.1 uncharacterized protein LOC117306814 [Asterias rubens]